MRGAGGIARGKGLADSFAAAFEAAGALVTEGARPEQVAQWLYESQPESAIRLLAEMLTTLEIHDERIASAFISTKMFERVNATAGDTEGLIDYPRSIAGVEAAALIRQVGAEEYKVSLRSRGEVDVEKVARRNGGGGHRNAAGFLASGSLESVRTQVVEELQQALV